MAVTRRRTAGKNRKLEKPDAPAAIRALLPTRSKGRRPEFYEDPAIDQLFAIVTALTGELSVLYDRLDTLERVLVEARTLSDESLEAYVAPAEIAEARVIRRDQLLRRVFAVLEAYADRQTAPAR
jgi:hypothetical protein